jgi:hypothetical protein
MCVSGKLKAVETISGMGIGEMKGNDGGSEFNYDIFGILQELL